MHRYFLPRVCIPLVYIVWICCMLPVSGQYEHPNLCNPGPNCMCMPTDSGMVDCNVKDNVLGIPVNFDSRQYTNLVIQNAPFPAPALLRRENVTGLAYLKRLKVIGCGLRKVEPGALSDMRSLVELDLSQNALDSVAPDTFRDMQLQVLRLDGNRHLTLYNTSFRGLRVETLSLRECDLKVIEYSTLALLADFRTVELYGNLIERVDPRMASLLEDSGSSNRKRFLDLTKNPLKCSCDMLWLANLVRQNVITSADNLQPLELSISCTMRNSNKSHPLALLHPSDLQCPRASIEEVMIDLTSLHLTPEGQFSNAKITCIASSIPVELAMGYVTEEHSRRPQHFVTRPADGNLAKNRVEMNVTLGKEAKAYYCMVKARDATWSGDAEQEVKLRLSMDPNSLRSQTVEPITSPDRTHLRFSALHLLLAVIVTFVVTFLLTLMVWRIHHSCCSSSRRYPWKPSSCSSLQAGSAYSTVKGPVLSGAANSRGPLPSIDPLHNNNNVQCQKSLLTSTSSDYDIPQQFATTNHHGLPAGVYQSHQQLLYPAITGPQTGNGAPGGLPVMGLSARTAGATGGYPHSRTLSTLRLPTASSASPLPSAGGGITAQQFIDFRTGQLCSSSALPPPPQTQPPAVPGLMSTSMSQPQGLHASLGFLS